MFGTDSHALTASPALQNLLLPSPAPLTAHAELPSKLSTAARSSVRQSCLVIYEGLHTIPAQAVGTSPTLPKIQYRFSEWLHPGQTGDTHTLPMFTISPLRRAIIDRDTS